jgi:uncharacterized membrane protein
MSDSRARLWFALFVLAVFCGGGAGGFILGRHLPPGPGGPPPEVIQGQNGPPFARGGLGRRGGPGPFGRGPAGADLPPPVAERLANDLQLDAAQRAQFRKVLDDHRDKLEQIHSQARGRFDGEQRELFDAIRALLRPDQVQRFEQFINGRRQ